MAGLDHTSPPRAPQRHDGIASCRVCASADAAADHDWCPAAGGLVCDACCRRVLLGDALRFASAMNLADGTETAEALVNACLGCDRGRRWYEEQIRDHLAAGSEPC